jgi:hypothetical protein
MDYAIESVLAECLIKPEHPANPWFGRRYQNSCWSANGCRMTFVCPNGDIVATVMERIGQTNGCSLWTTVHLSVTVWQCTDEVDFHA